MFEPPPASVSRKRPMFVVSAAAHLALAAVLVVPPLFATPEAPEPDGFVRIESIPVVIRDAPIAGKNILLRKEEMPRGAHSAVARRSRVMAAQPALAQPSGLTELLPAPTGEQPETTFEEPGGHGEPGDGPPGSGARADGGEPGGCEGCSPISATALGVTAPVALETISPVYPELARRARVEGVVVMEAIIGADGSVRDVRVLRSASPLLETGAVESVRTWRYRAARIGERRVSVFLTVVVTFSLRNL